MDLSLEVRREVGNKLATLLPTWRGRFFLLTGVEFAADWHRPRARRATSPEATLAGAGRSCRHVSVATGAGARAAAGRGG
jgi:hypothetical protein